MNKEKHKWVKEKDYVNTLGDSKHHYVIEYEQCSKCGARRELQEPIRRKPKVHVCFKND